MTHVADLIRLVGLESMLRVAILVGVDGHRADPQLVGRSEGTDRDLAAIGHQQLGNHLRPLTFVLPRHTQAFTAASTNSPRPTVALTPRWLCPMPTQFRP